MCILAATMRTNINAAACAHSIKPGRAERRGFVCNMKKHTQKRKTNQQKKTTTLTWGAAATNNVKVIGSVSFQSNYNNNKKHQKWKANKFNISTNHPPQNNNNKPLDKLRKNRYFRPALPYLSISFCFYLFKRISTCFFGQLQFNCSIIFVFFFVLLFPYNTLLFLYVWYRWI